MRGLETAYAQGTYTPLELEATPMTPQPPLYQWIDRVTTHFPHLSRAQAVVLALWSFGMVLARSCGLSSVALVVAKLLGQRDNTVRQRLREWYREAPAKRGRNRTQPLLSRKNYTPSSPGV